jgi:pSer/pThr/pTyr-binding forkhead associated (FHA) protein
MPDGLVLEFVRTPSLRFVLTEQEATLGRSAKCQFVLNDPTISRMHAKVLRVDAHFAVLDLDSRNGTFVEEERVQNKELINGQRVRFGGLTFLARVEELEDPEVLSSGQRRVFERLMTGQSEKAIARDLKISPHTVHNHIQAIFRSLEVHSKAELIAKFLVGEARNTKLQ